MFPNEEKAWSELLVELTVLAKLLSDLCLWVGERQGRWGRTVGRP